MMPTDDLDAIRHLDFHTITCQCEQYGCDKHCPRPATVAVEFHAIDHCNNHTTDPDINPYGNYTFLLCTHCLVSLAAAADRHAKRLNQLGRAVCLTCGAPIAKAQPDIIREARKL